MFLNRLNHNKPKVILLFIAFLTAGRLHTDDSITFESTSRKKQVNEFYLKRFPVKTKTAEEALADMQKEQSRILWSKLVPQKVEFPAADNQRTAHVIVTNQTKEYENAIINMQSLDKLNIAYVKHIDGHGNIEYVSGLVDIVAEKCPSYLGKSVLLNMLANPTTDLKTIQERQLLIKVLQDKSTQMQKVINALHTAAEHEKGMLPLWNTSQELLTKFDYDSNYFGGPVTQFFHLDWLFKPLNKFPYFLESKTPGLMSILTGIWLLHTPEMALKMIKKAGTPADIEKVEIVTRMSYVNRIKSTVKAIPSVAKTAGPEIAAGIASAFQSNPGLMSVTTLYTGLIFWSLGVDTYNNENLFAHIQTYFIELASYLEQVRTVNQHLTRLFSLACPELEDHLRNLDNKSVHSSEFNQLIDLLKTPTFKGKSSKLSYLGRVKCAYKLFMNVRGEFEPILQAMGKLQMYLGVAELMQSSAHKENTFCFVEFVDYGPYVEAVDFWNPFVGQDNAISNSLFMTPDQKDIILHGPNTGGKTTTIKGLIYNILLAQTFGIGAARRLILSPFTQINCFMDIQDDVTAGSSLFDAEVRFATELHNRVKSLQPGQYAFTIADEILRSTSPSKGQACAYQFTKKLAKNPNSASITVTHYPKLVELANEIPSNGFRTFHVEIRRENGKVIRTYKLKEGSTTENIAGDILQEHGIFDGDDLAEVARLEEEFAA